MPPPLPPRVAAAVAATVADLVAAGTSGVVLLGSQSRGDAHEHSDVDLVALGSGPEYMHRQLGGLLMSVSWRTADAVRASFADPKLAGSTVPGWRAAVILHDAHGTANELSAEAGAWRWSDIEGPRVAWIAGQMTGRAEVVQRLVGSLAAGRRTSAAVTRNRLATRLPVVAAVHHRILYDSEHRLFDLVADAMGPSWRRSQDAALGLRGEQLADSCRAALGLYAQLAPVVEPYLNAEQLAVVRSAAELAWATQHAA
ncbi:nucleotidyltransferase domain-containing protein [Cryptosporangium minutisporangium]|uniref:Polymerase nucleotidyl transferase domain-containing protein n=1 Tax=Cryptosporangium minutisporangium TaxID=113569 RepID=A0ABP6TAM4_9ACTN